MNQLNFHHAIEIVEQIKVRQTNEQAEKLQEFLESKCDMFSSADWFYYAEVTGKSLEWLKDNASYSDSLGMYGTMLNNAIIDNDFELAEFYINKTKTPKPL